ncbi:MAG TPA: SusC/RagA family TonB-linked outer membrane protein [Bacteroidales bacterium]
MKKHSKFEWERFLFPKNKLLLIMRLSTLLLMLNLLSVNASVFSQDKFTLKEVNASVKNLLSTLESKSKVKFLYRDEVIENLNVTVDMKDASLEDAMDMILQNTGNTYRILDNNLVVIVPKETFQQQKITGKITDAATGEALIGVSISVEGTRIGTMSDANGNFTIEVPNENSVLLISYLGYLSENVKVSGISNLDIKLSPDIKKLDEVVVVGYGIQKKATLSGSVTSVQGKELAEIPVTNLSQGIAGRLPGVVAVSNTGEPGYDGVTLRIRGVNTFGNADPLVVVDGVPGRSLDRVDPSTIESMSVMKDASAAIYGAQAANGVILITTKRGKLGKPTVKFSYNLGFAKPTIVPKMCNASEYATLLDEVDKYAGNTQRYTADDIQKYSDGSDPWGHPNTDWFKETLKPWSAQNYGNISLDGGTEHIKYFVSISDKYQDGFYRNSGTKYNQYDLRSNVDVKVNKSIDLVINTTGRMEDRDFPVRSSEEIFRMLMRSKPNSPAYWPNGLPGPDVEFGDNPVVICTNATGYDRDKRYVLNSDFGLNIKIPWIEGLSLKGNASLDKTFQFHKIWQTPWYLYSWDKTSYDANGVPLLTKEKKGFDDARLSEAMEDDQNILISGLLNYTRTFAKVHKVGVLFGSERITGKGDSFNAFRRYFLSSSVDQMFAGGQAEMNTGGSAYNEARLNYFGRANYSYKDKYLAEFVWRYQASYIFEQSSRYGFFPGVSLGYVVSEENFWKQLSFINFAKIRASWGQTGNDLINPYQFLSTYSLNSLYFIDNGGATNNQALYEGVAPNKGVTWETATQRNIGVDLQFLKGEIALTVDYFNNKRENILWPRSASLPNTSGITPPSENIGKCSNKGVDFNLEYRKQLKDFSYGIGINGVYTKNKVLFWDEAPGVPDYQQSTGRPIGSALYYRAIGVFKDDASLNAYPHWTGARPGDIIFEDYNKDGKIDANDRVMYDKSRTPIFTGGVNLYAKYKGLDLSVLFQGAAGGVFYQDSESGDFANYLKDFYDHRWTEQNPSDKYPRTYNRTNEYWMNQANTYWLHKTDYIRLKNIELGYTLPSSITKRYSISSFRLYVSAFNLLTYSPDMKNYDPENSNNRGYNYPLSKVVNVGLNVTF